MFPQQVKPTHSLTWPNISVFGTLMGQKTQPGLSSVIHHRNKNKALTSTITQEIGDSSDVENVRAVIVGKNSGGTYSNVTIGGEDSLNVDITNPLTSFGELSVAQPHMKIQSAFVYDEIGPGIWIQDVRDGGSVDVVNSLGQLSIDGTIGAYAALRTVKNIHYSPGQGLGCRFTTIFNEGVIGSQQTGGIMSSNDGIGFGIDGDKYGVYRKHNGTQEVQRLSVTGATAQQTITITLGGFTYDIVVEPGSAEYVAHTLSIYDYGPLYATEHHGNCVIFVHTDATRVNDLYTVDSDGDVRGVFERITEGMEPIVQWTYQEDFNVDRLDGTGPSRMTINPKTGNVCQITYHWLGFGNFAYAVENPQTGRFIVCHRDKYANAHTALSLITPSMPVQFTLRSITSSTPMNLRIGSVCGYIEGLPGLNGSPFSIRSVKQWRNTPFRPKDYGQNIITLMNGRLFRGLANHATLIPTSLTVRTKTTNDMTVTVILNPEHIGTDTPDDYHIYKHKDAEHSTALYDETAVSVRGGVILEEAHLKGKDSINIDLSRYDVTLESMQSIVVRGQVEKYGTGSVTATIFWTEFH